MQNRLRVRRCIAAAATLAATLALAGCGGNVGDQKSEDDASFPDRGITLLVGQDAGGSTDLTARAVADPADSDLKQTVTVLNKPGANGALAAKELAGAKADGYTLMVFVGSLAYITPLAVPADEALDINDYEVVTGLSQDDYVLVASAESGFKTVKDIVDAKKAIKYGTTGVGTGSHLSQALLFSQAKVDATAVPFDGGAPTLTAVMGGQVDVASVQLGEAQPQIKAGRIAPLVTFADKRPSYMPDTPTAVEAGYDVPVQQSRAIVAPKGTPKDVVVRLRTAFQKVFADAEYKDFNTQRLLTPNEVDGPTVIDQWTAALKKYRDLTGQYKIDLSED
ncbi:tripartite tricarboxylate transporter substrate binding protein [Streptomyces europaeiscabiei]|uniref:tripartite tricarboxylate transporter substrate binding protein n=1 Tax=Streptomyces TaxID=1883 RepID=UPI000A3B0760|nr:MULTISPECIES: tripartite tricarboxylate transporter substrate binding protein [Streptomyces]MDX3636974.1 tripartite tricarboxylate transporter substrate binding protein [Streptomyces europaeiscabiei]MDX3652802.1 tripartite tricarboxylate transporter substrate binding protein [Streptomyces europaeiscabiei]